MGIFEGIGISVVMVVLGLLFPRVCFVIMACFFLNYVLGFQLFPKASGMNWENSVSAFLVLVGIVMFVLDVWTIKFIHNPY